MSWKDESRREVKDKMSGTSYKLANGTNTFRIAPNVKGLDHRPFIQGRVHRDVGPDAAMCACGKDIKGRGECWGCDKLIPHLQKAEDPGKQALAEKIGPREIFITQVFPFDPETGKFTAPKPFWVSTGRGTPGYVNPARPTLAVQVQSRLSMGNRSYDDPVRGYNITIVRHGTGPGKGTQYEPPEGSDDPSKVPQDLLKLLKPLEEFLPRYNEEDFKACYYGKPRPERRQSAAVPAAVETEVDEDTQAEIDEGGFDPNFDPDGAEIPDGEALDDVVDEEPIDPNGASVDDEIETVDDEMEGSGYNPEFEQEDEPIDPEPPSPPRRATAVSARRTAPAPLARRPVGGGMATQSPARRPTQTQQPTRRPVVSPQRPGTKPTAKPTGKPATKR